MSDERKASLAVLLSILVIFTWTNLFMAPTTPVPSESKPTNEESLENKEAPAKFQEIKNDGDNGLVENFESVAQNNLKKITHSDYLESGIIDIETDLAKIKITKLGGRLLSYQIKDHKEDVSKPDLKELVTAKGIHLPLGASYGGLDDSNSKYAIAGVTSGFNLKADKFKTKGKDFSLVLKAQLANGVEITKQFEFLDSSYLFNFNVEASSRALDGSNLVVEWSEDLSADFQDNRYNPRSFIYLDSKDSLDKELIESIPDENPEVLTKWIGLGDNYFGAIIVNPNGLIPTRISSKLNGNGEKYLSIKAQGTKEKASFKIYAGPKEPSILRNVGYDLYKAIDLGWFAFVGQPILMLIKFCYSLFGNYGLAIVFVTLLIKILLLPLTKTSFKSMRAMQDIQPEMKALRERVKDPQMLQQEMLALYKRKGVNPMGGCLPMLLQIPVFLGMYNALQSSIYLRHAEFALWINDLSQPERLIVWGIPIPFMILLMGGSMFLQTLTTPTAMDPNQKKIMYFMPVVFTIMFIIYPFPSGLVLYWLVNNIISFIQQYALRTETKIHPYRATFASGILVFGIAYLVTLL